MGFSEIPGVLADATGCGIKPGRDDLSVIYLREGIGAVGVFTRNLTAAACIEYTRAACARGEVRGVVINAGNANAATGAQGIRDARETARRAAKLLGCRPHEIAVASTGIIGKLMPMEKIRAGLGELLSREPRCASDRVARAIMTTDLVPKEVTVRRIIAGVEVIVSGIAKGSGMIAPNMATMLGFLVTNVAMPRAHLHRALRVSTDRSFNMTSVDTDTSTNDMVLLFSTGERKLPTSNAKVRGEFEKLLTEACETLAKMIARDGEGATKLIEVRVQGARTERDARTVARSVVNSPLVKTAIHGADPNWGRVIAAAGKDPKVDLELTRLDVAFGGVVVLRRGTPQKFDHDAAVSALRRDTVSITLDLHRGRRDATAWGCDLTKGYIDINVDYN